MKTMKLIQLLLLVIFLASCSSDEETPPVIEPPEEIGAPHSIEVFDIGNDGNSSDIRVFFTAGSNLSEVEEYRVMVTKTASASSLDTESALQVASGSYHTLASSMVNIKINLNEITDIDGDAIQNDTNYTLFILAVPKSEEVEARLSAGSTDFALTNKELKDLYISSNKTHSIELFDGVTGEHIRSFIPASSGGLINPQEIIFMDDGTVLITGYGNTAIKKYNSETGAYIGDFTTGYNLANPTKTNIGPDGHLYVSQWGTSQNSIVRFNLQTGAFIDEVVDSYHQGMDQSWDADGNFYAVSWGLGELRKYDDQFQLIASTNNQLTGPVNMWIDGTGVLFVVDWSVGQVKRFDSDLNFMGTFITGLTRVEGYQFYDGNILLCDWMDSKVNLYNGTTGAFIKTMIDSPQIQEANDVAFGPDHRPG